MNRYVFRKVALDRLSSPEQLDTLLTVTQPRAWLALVGIGCLLLAVMVWSFSGSISTKVYGQGILVKSEGVQNIVSTVNGQLTDLSVQEGDTVERGDVIARISQPQLLADIYALQVEYEQLRAREETQEQSAQLAALERELARLRAELEVSSRIVSPVSGQVVEVKVNKRDFVEVGTPIVSLELTGGQIKDLEAVMYVPAEDGKTIFPGMEVQLAPSSVKKEEYGYMVGRVVSVAEYPASFQGMMRTLGNEELVRSLAGGGPVLEVRVDLIPDETTASGYKWTSSQGPPHAINSGTLVAGAITVDRQPPIALLFPHYRSR